MNYLIELIIRPQRNVYNPKDLGDSAFSFSGQDFKRLDFTNGQVNKNICLSFLFFFILIKFLINIVLFLKTSF